MAFMWDAKNNFILSYFVNLYQQQLFTTDINWSSIVHDIHLEISSTPTLLQNQYEHLLRIFYPKNDSQSLHSTLKDIYLHSLCQQIEEDSKLTLEAIYELVRQTRAKRINTNDFEQLIKEWNFNYASEEQKGNKDRLLNVLNRLRDYSLSFHNRVPQNPTTNGSSPSVVPKEPLHSESEDKNPTTIQQNGLVNTNDPEKSPMIRRRAQSLTLFGENKASKVNIGVEWFVPKFKRQQRSSSLHARSQSPIPLDSLSSDNRNQAPDRTLLTTVENDESPSSMDHSHLRQTQAQPVISWLPLTEEQVVEKERRQTESKSLIDQDLEQVSSTDSDSIEIEGQIPSNNQPSHDLHQSEHNPCKRQRITSEEH